MTSNHFLNGEMFKLVFFGGKGGVGKTTCAVSHALNLAVSRPEDSFLLVSTDPAHSVNDSISTFHIPSNLEIRELDAAKALDTFKLNHREKLRMIASRGTFFDEPDIDQVLELSLPGLDELMAFLEISQWINSEQYESVIVDTAPTGHTLRLLEMPKLINGWLNALDILLAKHRYMKKIFQGSYKKDDIDVFLLDLANSVKTMEKRFSDKKKCRFVPVFLAEPLSLSETQTLLSRLKKGKFPVTDLIVNRIYPLTDCPVCAGEHHGQIQRLGQFFHTIPDLNIWAVPLYPKEILGDVLTDTFWQGIYSVTPSLQSANAVSAETRSQIDVENCAPWPVDDLNLLIFAGKGGVGKTTMACATACGVAENNKNRQVLIFSTDPAHSLSQCFDTPIGPVPVKLTPRLSAVEIDASKDFNALKKAYEDELQNFLTDFSSSLDLTFDQQVMEQLMELAPPGLDEVMALNMAMDFISAGSCDLLILDSAPTGHLIRLLQTPELMDQWLKVIFNLLLKYKNFFRLPKLSVKLIKMSKSLKMLRRILTDPEKSALYAVSILNHMALEETRDLLSACHDMNINVPVVFLNMATHADNCPLCTAVSQRESKIKKQFAADYPDLIQPVIYRNPMELQGIEILKELAANMYE
ncbi:arsenite efflux ATP-binding protein ArsA [Desulfocicer vacuolatum DSM 3385]|uniref:arsenite-transporting ATPase n=1 Tax=Desulfocicer vacuolatum DSM 3385 TaxID=1121400 RepID=A0A1W2BDA0_9BACT|nr:ArsA family ATPase [Desulfocicer vacuolatum]SMC70947.1 arsenite efflux ATP-binding protein ArsA [Desulfocicer vacuolatum DSM 3385]